MAAGIALPPPSRNGVGPSCVGLPPGPWPTFLDFLCARFPGVAAPIWQQRIAAGLVTDAATGKAIEAAQAYAPHGRLHYFRDLHLPGGEKPIPFQAQILYQDAHLVVADKPHFLPVAPTGAYVEETLLVRLKQSLQIDTLVPLHRIDRDTAGIVLLGVVPGERDAYQALFRQRLVEKTYEAIAHWQPGHSGEAPVFPLLRESRIVPGEPFFKQCEMPGTPNSQTQIALLEQCGTQGRFRLHPATGKKHQLRVHMQALGWPILNDRLYGTAAGLPLSQDDDPARPLQLLAQAIAFVDPVTGEMRHFQSRLRLDFERV